MEFSKLLSLNYIILLTDDKHRNRPASLDHSYQASPFSECVQFTIFRLNQSRGKDIGRGTAAPDPVSLLDGFGAQSADMTLLASCPGHPSSSFYGNDILVGSAIHSLFSPLMEPRTTTPIQTTRAHPHWLTSTAENCAFI